MQKQRDRAAIRTDEVIVRNLDRGRAVELQRQRCAGARDACGDGIGGIDALSIRISRLCRAERRGVFVNARMSSGTDASRIDVRGRGGTSIDHSASVGPPIYACGLSGASAQRRIRHRTLQHESAALIAGWFGFQRPCELAKSRKGSYRLLPTVVNVADAPVPTAVTAAMTTTAINEAINPYSRAVTPRRSLRKQNIR